MTADPQTPGEASDVFTPVWDGYCADPFVLATDEGYVMYGTDPGVRARDGRVLVVLHSPDLVHWRRVGGALEPLADEPADAEYWAPEAAAADGTYYLYYSVGSGDSGHALRVASAGSPLGPFRDLGVNLTPDLPFAIDPSPLQDADGNWWLYFATDRLTGKRPGTVLAVAPMHDMTRLGESAVVLTATEDWQRYESDRLMYGARYDWHTLEGPQVVHRDGRYWMTFSGGNWQTENYGVAAAYADHPAGPWTVVGSGPTVLSSALGGLVGPGHNSLVTGPDGRDRIVFHAWDDARTQRRPHIAPLAWHAGGPRISR